MYCDTRIEWDESAKSWTHAKFGPRGGSVFCDDHWTTIASPKGKDAEQAELNLYNNTFKVLVQKPSEDYLPPTTTFMIHPRESVTSFTILKVDEIKALVAFLEENLELR